ncbi:hypothetical protein GCM10010347_63220 [Streptomyces cirratus]|uniref:Response regulatory domain-containing protein n=1 Tax=Streptomyces cirratus TaxID=68187 RepID=A0ABQ3F4M2_9ACTN|nr:hypothetical protein [Streptomyces cirratus]GHB83698.1 hypothetical protein GCM10010347_63220 [Streptomyces cirratus]
MLDVRFPGGGPYTAQQIVHAVPGMRILVFSAYGDQGARTETAEAGVAGYLVKGITNARLLTEVRTLGDATRAFSSGPTSSTAASPPPT